MTNTNDLLQAYSERAGDAFSDARKCGVARDAAIYLTHTESGRTMRDIARATGTHPSTISRAVRRVEAARDDPIIDRILKDLEENGMPTSPPAANQNRSPKALCKTGAPDKGIDLEREARKFLRRLCEPDAFLLIVEGMDKAGIFCGSNEHRRPIAMFPVEIAAGFFKQDWIKVAKRGGRSVRYLISDVGRSALRRMLAADESERRGAAAGFADGPTAFQGQHQIAGERVFADPESDKAEVVTVNIAESPIGWLTRRRGADGKSHLTPEEVEAAERLRGDFEAAQMGPSITQDWQRFLTVGCESGTAPGSGEGGGASAARDRVVEALAVLGPGLADVAMRTCCFLEGLEACERRMGWNPRSAKVVLKIALQRLALHYGIVPFIR